MKNQQHRFEHLPDLYGSINVSCLIGPVSNACMDELLPEEFDAIQYAVDKRKAEYSSARRIARHLLLEHRIYDFPLLNDSQRVPIWPTGFVGSISHSDQMCAVALHKIDSSGVANVGIDIEVNSPVEPELTNHILVDEEISQLGSLSEGEFNHHLRWYFCCKEAVYKCLYPLTRRPFEFHDLIIHLDLLNFRFDARILDPLTQKKMCTSQISGRFIKKPDYVVAAVHLFASDLAE